MGFESTILLGPVVEFRDGGWHWNGLLVLQARETAEATARAEAAEQRAEAAEREVARLRGVIADEAAELPVWPADAYQTPAERDVSGVRARLLAALGVTR